MKMWGRQGRGKRLISTKWTMETRGPKRSILISGIGHGRVSFIKGQGAHIQTRSAQYSQTVISASLRYIVLILATQAARWAFVMISFGCAKKSGTTALLSL
jgi:hypothetical protein